VKIISVSLQEAQPPEEVQEAFEDVNSANQDRQRLINLGEAYANNVIPKARGAASRLIAEAEGYKLTIENEAQGNVSRFEQILAQYRKAPEVTKKRLYLDAQEQIMSSVSKIIVDQQSGGNLLYLPLDQLMKAGNSSKANTEAPSPSVDSQVNTNNGAASSDYRSRDAFRSRERPSR